MTAPTDKTPFLDKAQPKVWDALQVFSASVGAAGAEVGLSDQELELLKVHASQLNGCAYCLDLHTRKARSVGVSQQKLDTVIAWRETLLFSKREISLLSIAQAVTRLPLTERSRIELAEARDCLGDDAFAVAEWVAITINTFNRVSIFSHHPVQVRDDQGKIVK